MMNFEIMLRRVFSAAKIHFVQIYLSCAEFLNACVS